MLQFIKRWPTAIFLMALALLILIIPLLVGSGSVQEGWYVATIAGFVTLGWLIGQIVRALIVDAHLLPDSEMPQDVYIEHSFVHEDWQYIYRGDDSYLKIKYPDGKKYIPITAEEYNKASGIFIQA